jgi:hypothetical protein
MSHDPAPFDARLHEELVAYLDGELDPAGSRRIEELLANDPRVRHTVHGLDCTWQLLDELDRPEVAQDFTKTTLEMVVVAAEEDVVRQQSDAPRRRRRRRLLIGGGVLAAGLAGFLVVAMFTSNPNRQLLQDLPILENFDSYRQVDGIEFLRMLSRERLFTEDSEESPPEWPELLEEMSPEQQQQVLRHREQFQSLSAGQQQRIRQFHEQLEQDPEGEKLREVLCRYCQWLATLPHYRRAELLESDAADRIKLVKRFQGEQAKIVTRRLDAKDREGVLRWLDQYASENEGRLLETAPEQRRQQAAKMTPGTRHRMVMLILCQRWVAGNPALHPPVSDAQMADLRGRVAPETRTRLEAKPAAEQAQIVAGWLRQAARGQLTARRGEGALPGFDEQLADFFEFQLSDEERDRLLSLPSEEMQQKLREMYLTQTRPLPGGAHRPGPGKKSWPPGERPRPKRDLKVEKQAEKQGGT